MYTSCCLHGSPEGVPIAFYYSTIEHHTKFSKRYDIQLNSWVWDTLKAAVLHKESLDKAVTWEVQYGVLRMSNTAESFSIPYVDARRLLALQHDAYKSGQLYEFCYYNDIPALGVREQDNLYYIIDYATLEVVELEFCTLVNRLLCLVNQSIDYSEYTSILREYFY